MQNLDISYCCCAEDGIAIVLLLNILFGDVPVAAAVAVFLSSLFSHFVRSIRASFPLLGTKNAL